MKDNNSIIGLENMDIEKWKTEIQNGTMSDDCLFWLIKNSATLRNYILVEAVKFILDNKGMLLFELEAKLSALEKEN